MTADKKHLQVNVRLSTADWQAIQEAGRKLWPGLEVPAATVIRTLARQRAEEILKKRKDG